MRLGIACPGPSMVSRLRFLESCDLVVAINSAVERVDCDYWCFGDFETFAFFTIPGGRDPILFVGTCVLDNVEREPTWAAFRRRRRLAWKDVAARPDDNGRWETFSATAALVLAAHLGADRVEVIGADMLGDSDFAGRPCSGRSEERWQQERPIWQETVAWLETLGIAVARR